MLGASQCTGHQLRQIAGIRKTPIRRYLCKWNPGAARSRTRLAPDAQTL